MMKIIISNKQYGVLREQIDNRFAKVEKPSDYLGKGGGLERKRFEGQDAEKYIQALSTKKPAEIKKIRLIFPSYNWEVIALNLLKKLGVVTGVFTNLTSANNFIKKLAKRGVKADEFVVGSHGHEGTLLFTKEGKEDTMFDNTFLENFKQIVKPDTKVFFTACSGADYLDTLKDAAERLGVGAYGSAGIYNYIRNESEKGFYWCSPLKFTPDVQERMVPWEYDNNLKVNLLMKEAIEDVKTLVTIKKGVFDTEIPPFEFLSETSDSKTVASSVMRGINMLETVEIQLQYNIIKQVLKNLKPGETDSKNTYRRKESELNNKNEYMSPYIRKKFTSDEIIVQLFVNGQYVNVKSLPPVEIPVDIDNDFLLKKGLCKKVSGPPVNWI